LLNMIDGIQQIGLARARARAADINPGNRAPLAKYNRASCWPARVGKVADLDSGDVGYVSIRERHYNRMLN